MRHKFSLLAICITAMFLSSCDKETLTQSGIAEDHFFLKSGNQHMPVIVGGNLDAKKMLIIIHGGPGGNAIDYRDNHIISEVEKDFAVVYWDQRFSGNTQGNGGNSHISEFRKDIKKLLILLRAKYGPEMDFYLFAHSWGGFLAPYFLIEEGNQDMVKGWIQIGGAHNYSLNDSLTREMLLYYGNNELAAGNNIDDWEEIVEWCEDNGYEGRENAGTLNGFAHRAEGLIEDVIEPDFDLELAPYNQTAFFSQVTNGWISAIREIDNPAYSTPNSDQLYKIQIPALLLWGQYDFVCPPALADDIEHNIGSSDVSKVIYLQSGHSPMANQPTEFWSDVVEWVKLH